MSEQSPTPAPAVEFVNDLADGLDVDLPIGYTLGDRVVINVMAEQVAEMYAAYQIIKPAVEQMSADLSSGGIMALMPALLAGMRGGK